MQSAAQADLENDAPSMRSRASALGNCEITNPRGTIGERE